MLSGNRTYISCTSSGQGDGRGARALDVAAARVDALRARALGLPPNSHSMGYYSIGLGNVPQGLTSHASSER